MLIWLNSDSLSKMVNVDLRDALISHYNNLNGTNHSFASLTNSDIDLKIPFRYTEVDGANNYHKQCFGLLEDDGYLYDWDYATYNLFDKSDKNKCQGCCLQILATQLLNELGFSTTGSNYKSYKQDITDNMAFIEGLYPEGMRQGNKWFVGHPSITLADYTKLSGYLSKKPKS